MTAHIKHNALINEVEKVLNDWINHLTDDEHIDLERQLEHGGRVFVEVAIKPPQYVQRPRIRIGLETAKGRGYFSEFVLENGLH